MKNAFGKFMKKIRDVDLNLQANSEKRKDKRAQKWREIKIQLKKIPFVSFLVRKRNAIRRKFKSSKFYMGCCSKIDKILTPEIRKKLWDIRRTSAYKIMPKVVMTCLIFLVVLVIVNNSTNGNTSSASETKEKEEVTTKKEIVLETSPEPTVEPEPTSTPKETKTPYYEPFVATEDNTKWLEGAAKNVFDDKNYKDVKGYKFYFKQGKVASTLGIDVSAHQGYINWEKVAKTGVKFAMIRVGVRGHKTGKIQFDSYFKYNIENAKKNGLKVGVYFFTQAITTKEALEEANFVLNCIKEYELDMPVVFDMEYVGYITSRTKLANLTNEQRTDIAITFLEHVKKAGYVPMFYANKNWLEQAIQLSRLNNYCIWFARYNDVPDYKYRYHMWQYTEKGKITGINGAVDINVCLVNFDKYIKKDTKKSTDGQQSSVTDSSAKKQSLTTTQNQTTQGTSITNSSEKTNDNSNVLNKNLIENNNSLNTEINNNQGTEENSSDTSIDTDTNNSSSDEENTSESAQDN